MEKKFIFSFLILLMSLSTVAQEVQWASKIMEFSSQSIKDIPGPYFSNQQILKAPNVMPAGGYHPNAWMPSTGDGPETIKVGFKNPQRIRQIIIAESYNASAIKEVYIYDFQDVPHLVYSQEPSLIAENGRVLNIMMDWTAFDVYAVRLMLDGTNINSFYGIDAIGITESEEKVDIEVNLAENLNPFFTADLLSSGINSPYRETAPVFSPDFNTLYFARENHPNNAGGIEDPLDIWFSEYNSTTGEWTEAKNIGEPLNNSGSNFITSIRRNGEYDVAVLGNTYTRTGSMRTGVSVSQKKIGEDNSTWEKPEAFKITDDYNFSEKVDFHLSENRRILILSEKRNEGRGGRDLWASFLLDNGNFSKPLNLGPMLNTAGEEFAPFLAPDMKTLYFASDGHSGFGGSDIYMTKRLDDTWTNWSTPVNLGPNVNTAQDESYLNLTSDGESIYFVRGNADGDLDIMKSSTPLFRTPPHEVQILGKVHDAETKNPIVSTISYYDEENKLIGSTQTNASGYYQIYLDADKVYTYQVEIDCYENFSAKLDLNIPKDSTMALVDLYLDQIITQNARDLAVFFDLGSAQLNMEESSTQLDLLYNFLRSNNGVSIEIAGHTCTIGGKEFNDKLSMDRANAVRNEMMKRGIDGFRIQAQGFGYSDPIASNDTEEGRIQNRRVEFTITENRRCSDNSIHQAPISMPVAMTSPAVNVEENKREVETATMSNTTDSKPREKVESSYLVKKGDTYYSIARTHQMSVPQLYALNGIDENTVLKWGTRIKVMDDSNIESDSPSNSIAAAPNTEEGFHTVGKSDTLWNISQRYGTTVEIIKQLNNLNNNTIYLGQKLKLPQRN
ncbi:LysM peptidoglycan-binding domain-containing protein [Peijinzhouia sedimentorum]